METGQNLARWSYPPEVVADVLHQYGRETAAALAVKHGLVSRHAVIGIWARARTAGWKPAIVLRPGKPPGAPRETKPKPARLPATRRTHEPSSRPDPMLPLPKELPQPLRIRLMQLRPHSCRWPLGEYRDKVEFFCGAPKHAGRSYCLAHCQIAYPLFGQTKGPYSKPRP